MIRPQVRARDARPDAARPLHRVERLGRHHARQRPVICAVFVLFCLAVFLLLSFGMCPSVPAAQWGPTSGLQVYGGRTVNKCVRAAPHDSARLQASSSRCCCARPSPRPTRPTRRWPSTASNHRRATAVERAPPRCPQACASNAAMAIHGEREKQRGEPDRGRGRLTRRSVAQQLDCALI